MSTKKTKRIQRKKQARQKKFRKQKKWKFMKRKKGEESLTEPEKSSVLDVMIKIFEEDMPFVE